MNKAGAIGNEEEHEVRDFLCFTDAAERSHLAKGFIGRLCRPAWLPIRCRRWLLLSPHPQMMLSAA